MRLVRRQLALATQVGWDVTDVQLEDYFDPFIEDLHTIRGAQKECKTSRTQFARKMTLPRDTEPLGEISVTFEDFTRTSLSSAA